MIIEIKHLLNDLVFLSPIWSNDGVLDPFWKEWVLIPLLIFSARLIDVSMSTIRIVLIVNERRIAASILSFLEMFVWLVAVTQTLKNLSNVMCYIGFAGGFAVGTYIGMMIERKLSMGIVLIRVITTMKDGSQLITFLKEHKFRITTLNAEGNFGKTNIIYTVINRKEMNKVIDVIKQFNPNAFYTVENIRYLNEQHWFNADVVENKTLNFLRRIKIK